MYGNIAANMVPGNTDRKRSTSAGYQEPETYWLEWLIGVEIVVDRSHVGPDGPEFAGVPFSEK